jgi:SSS family solute:Na+ symporter
MIVDLLPVGLKGLMIASFFSAFISTMDTHYNMTASYLVNDVYKRFAVRGRSERHYVAASRWMTILVAVIAGVLALGLPSVLGALRFKMELMAGLGLIYVLRWAWWRINATTELVALVTSVMVALVVQVLPFASGDTANASAMRLVLVVAVSALAALVATFLTRPEPDAHLVAFYRRVRPFGWWAPVARAAGGRLPSGFGLATLGQIALSMIFLIAGVTGLGKLLLGEPLLGIAIVGAAAIGGTLTTRWIFRTHRPIDEPARVVDQG